MLVKRWGIVLLSLVAGALTASAVTGGCQSDSGGDNATDDGTPGSGGNGASSSGTGNSSSDGGAAGSSSTTSQGGSGNTGGGDACAADEHTIEDITTGKVGEGIVVNLKGVVAMSHKYLVFGSKNTGSCLWGVYVSAPGITETAPNTGILIVSYGDEMVTSDAGTFCPKLGVEPTGGNIPDDVKPGDVIDINGKVDPFLPSTCGATPEESSVPQFQVASNLKACPIKKTGDATPPTPHVLSAGEVASLSSPTDKAFHDKWGGVKVSIANVSPVLVTDPYSSGCDTCCASDAMPADQCIVNAYGLIQLEEGNLIVADDTYYRGYLKTVNKCHAGPIFAPTTGSFARITGFSSQDYCTWVLQPQDKCADFDPSSTDCGADTTCPFTTM